MSLVEGASFIKDYKLLGEVKSNYMPLANTSENEIRPRFRRDLLNTLLNEAGHHIRNLHDVLVRPGPGPNSSPWESRIYQYPAQSPSQREILTSSSAPMTSQSQPPSSNMGWGWSRPQQNQNILTDLSNHIHRKINFLHRLPYQILKELRNQPVGRHYQHYGSCQYRPCLSLRHAVDSFFTKGLFGG